jgi:hypothetical protein
LLAKTPVEDIAVSSASGNATLNYNGNPVEGHFELSVREDDGEIVCPFDIDKERRIERGGDDYIVKSFTKGHDSPRIKISSASGRAELKK